MPNEYYNELMKLAKKAFKKDEVPVSAMIVKDGKIIAKAYNTRKNKNNVFNHAEMLVIKKASGKLKDWRLEDCELYVTLKPCSMCEAAIKQSRIKTICYLVDKLDYKKEYNKTKIERTNIRTQSKEYLQYLQAFFQKKRDKTK